MWVCCALGNSCAPRCGEAGRGGLRQICGGLVAQRETVVSCAAPRAFARINCKSPLFYSLRRGEAGGWQPRLRRAPPSKTRNKPRPNAAKLRKICLKISYSEALGVTVSSKSPSTRAWSGVSDVCPTGDILAMGVAAVCKWGRKALSVSVRCCVRESAKSPAFGFPEVSSREHPSQRPQDALAKVAFQGWYCRVALDAP